MTDGSTTERYVVSEISVDPPANYQRRTAAILFTMTASAKRHDLDPFAWLRDVLSRLPLLRATHDSPPDELLQPLLPDAWQPSACINQRRPR